MTYGTVAHELWLIEMEAEDDRWAGQPDVPTRAEVMAVYPDSCGCVVSTVYGGDCAHTVEEYDPSEFTEEEASFEIYTPHDGLMDELVEGDLPF